MLHKDLTVRQTIDQHSPLRFSRIPVYDTGPDDIIGIVHRPRIFESLRTGQDEATLESLVKPLHVVPEAASVAHIMDEFFSRREQFFHVVDEYGGTAGIVTLEDAVETLLGEEIVDETDPVTDMRELGERLRQARMNQVQLPSTD